jgi:aminoglycoside 3-N-acetyltransferase
MAVTKDMIKEGLSGLGLKEGDVVLFHSSLQKLGKARELVKLPDCGAQLVIDAFVETVGPDGLVIVPTLTATFGGENPRGPVQYAFDPAETPSRVGSITDKFWRRPEARRSAHPTHSLAAIGSRADEFVADHDQGSTFDHNGPYGRYAEWDGYICFFGTDTRTNTTLHAVEDWMKLPYMADATALVKQPDGSAKEVTVTQSPAGYRDFYKKDSMAERLYLGSGIFNETRIGSADVQLFKAKDCIDLFWNGILENPLLLLGNPGDSPFVDQWAEPTRQHIASGGAVRP